jgi:hypothetical protein
VLSSGRSLALFCLTLVLFSALTPVGVLFCVVFAPLFLFAALLMIVASRREAELFPLPLFPHFSLIASRAPPNL